jgi:hypothetical protein
VIEVIWARYVFAFVFMLAMFLPRSGLKLFSIRGSTRRWCAGCCCSFVLPVLPRRRVPAAGDRGVDLAGEPDHRDGALVAPAGETGGRAPLGRGGVGFIGALIVVRPGHAGFDWHVLLIVASTICSSFYQLFSRRYGQTERPDASATVATIVGTIAATPFVPFEWVMPATTWPMVLFVGMGIMAGTGHYFLTIAYSQAPACSGFAVQLHPADRLGGRWATSSSTTSPTWGPGSAPA